MESKSPLIFTEICIYKYLYKALMIFIRLLSAICIYMKVKILQIRKTKIYKY